MSEQQTPSEKYNLPKPCCQLVGRDGNAFAIMGRVNRALRHAGYPPEAISEYNVSCQSGDYNHLLSITMDWVDEAEEEEQ